MISDHEGVKFGINMMHDCQLRSAAVSISLEFSMQLGSAQFKHKQ
jgi:hypothetical protein